MNFISNKSLNNGTFSHFKRFLTSYTTRDKKIQNFPSQNFKTISHRTWRLTSTNLNIHTIHSQKLFMSGTSKWILFQIKSLNNRTFSHFKRFLTPYRTRDTKIQNLLSRNFKTIGHHTWRLASINLNIHTIHSQKLFMSGVSKWISFLIKSLNNGTFSHFKRFLTPYRTRGTKIQNLLSWNLQRVITNVDASLYYNSLAKFTTLENGTCQTGGCFFGTRTMLLFLNLLRDESVLWKPCGAWTHIRKFRGFQWQH